MGSNRAGRPLHVAAYAAEALGTALLVFCGLSIVIFDFMPHSPMARLLPNPWLLRLATGALFGGTGALIALSPIGRISGAHLDPVVSWAFWSVGSLSAVDAAAYSLSQGVGAILGALPLPWLWHSAGAAVSYGATLPTSVGAPWTAVLGEMAVTFALVGGILYFVGRDRLRPYTPALLPPLVALLVAIEAPLSGTSMNPARSLGPALISGHLAPYWIYILGPLLGAAAAAFGLVEGHAVYVAKIAHHGHDPRGRFHGAALGSLAHRLRVHLRPAQSRSR